MLGAATVTDWQSSLTAATEAPSGLDDAGRVDAIRALCEACNHAKQAPGWRARPGPPGGGHEIETMTPTGHRYQSRAPAVATIRRVPLRIDYVLTG